MRLRNLNEITYYDKDDIAATTVNELKRRERGKLKTENAIILKFTFTIFVSYFFSLSLSLSLNFSVVPKRKLLEAICDPFFPSSSSILNSFTKFTFIDFTE